MNQITNTILMVRPAAFGFNEETAANNAFQVKNESLSAEEIQERALQEFDTFVNKLRAIGVEVIVVEDSADPHTPDAIFPNNWISFHQDGLVVTYPMFSSIRRKERRPEIISDLMADFSVETRIFFEDYEREEKYLEGTGSLILDRINKIMYACLSPRTDRTLTEELAQRLDYKAVIFTAVDEEGQEIYHTNVMMALGENFAVICLDVIADIMERQEVIEVLEDSGKEIIEISIEQMMQFAGNMLQVKGEDSSYLVMSQAAYDSLDEEQIEEIEQYTKILSSPIPTIEELGGGSVRCMMAEVFLPKLNA
jgi:hypothetical protein